MISWKLTFLYLNDLVQTQAGLHSPSKLGRLTAGEYSCKSGRCVSQDGCIVKIFYPLFYRRNFRIKNNPKTILDIVVHVWK